MPWGGWVYKKAALLPFICILGFFSSKVLADDEFGFDSIVKELTLSQPSRHVQPQLEDEVMIHTGFGFAHAFFEVDGSEDRVLRASQSGFQLSLGIDLFSPQWVAEGAVRNFAERSYKEGDVQLKEFDLKFLLKNRLSSSSALRMGLGMSGRYLDVRFKKAKSQFEEFSETTPSGLVLLGLENYLAPKFSIGADFQYKIPMIDETRESAALDLTLKVEAHF